MTVKQQADGVPLVRHYGHRTLWFGVPNCTTTQMWCFVEERKCLAVEEAAERFQSGVIMQQQPQSPFPYCLNMWS